MWRKFCINVEYRKKLLMWKLDGLHKHNGIRKCKRAKPRQIVGEYHTSFNTQHVKNFHIYCITGPNIVLDQVVNAKKILFLKKKPPICYCFPPSATRKVFDGLYARVLLFS